MSDPRVAPVVPDDPNHPDHPVYRIEVLISTLLRVGVAVSLGLVVIGTVVTFVRHPIYVTSHVQLVRLTQPGAAFPHSWRGVLDQLVRLRGQAIVTLGLLLLIATPVMRVAVSIFAFRAQRDRTYTAITTLVLCLLLLSFVLGRIE